MKIIILSGGCGTRLWPLSRETYPKQFFRLVNENSLLEKTLLRFLEGWDPEDIIIVTNKNYFYLVKDQACRICSKFENQIVIEPERKSTGPAIALAIKYLQEYGYGAEECVFVSSSDYYVSPNDKFISIVKSAEEVARKGKIVTFGTVPNRPETAYGYIKIKEPPKFFFSEVENFIEKPSLELAQEFVKSGMFLWNCGLFAFQIKFFLEEMNKHVPEISTWMQGNYQETLENFSKMPSISIDHSLMEKSKNIAVIPMNITWSDVGCWDSMFDALPKDANKNVKIGHIFDMDTKNSLIIGGKRLISTIGIEDLIIIDTEDAIFLGKKGESQLIKKLVEKLNILEKKESREHTTVYRPWGSYIILEETPTYKVKKIVVNSCQKISLQYHQHRSEHWVVIKGEAIVTKNNSQLILKEGESIDIPKKIVHRLENVREDILEIIEIQTGQYLGEDDIIRLEDIYERSCEKIHAVSIAKIDDSLLETVKQ